MQGENSVKLCRSRNRGRIETGLYVTMSLVASCVMAFMTLRGVGNSLRLLFPLSKKATVSEPTLREQLQGSWRRMIANTSWGVTRERLEVSAVLYSISLATGGVAPMVG
jgi:hypothetical protein